MSMSKTQTTKKTATSNYSILMEYDCILQILSRLTKRSKSTIINYCIYKTLIPTFADDVLWRQNIRNVKADIEHYGEYFSSKVHAKNTEVKHETQKKTV